MSRAQGTPSPAHDSAHPEPLATAGHAATPGQASASGTQAQQEGGAAGAAGTPTAAQRSGDSSNELLALLLRQQAASGGPADEGSERGSPELMRHGTEGEDDEDDDEDVEVGTGGRRAAGGLQQQRYRCLQLETAFAAGGMQQQGPAYACMAAGEAVTVWPTSPFWWAPCLLLNANVLCLRASPRAAGPAFQPS